MVIRVSFALGKLAWAIQSELKSPFKWVLWNQPELVDGLGATNKEVVREAVLAEGMDGCMGMFETIPLRQMESQESKGPGLGRAGLSCRCRVWIR